ncbi:hypothetical protein DH2020_015646 [Rehmannia glutinosa]|uniref:Plastid lipid-associated protein/fibrillin conserved domain-containing protein n=1 Tax=Rehmannia glutinosa TaxID=99300 RepID=A0ABR0WUB2_REHGL
MATKFIQSPIPASHVFPRKPNTIIKNAAILATHNIKPIRFGFCSHSSSSSSSFKDKAVEKLAAADDKVIITEEESTDNYRNIPQIKQHLFTALQGINNRGIFGVPSAKKSEIEKFVQLLEFQNPTPDPTLCLEKVAGAWKLIYSTITILGSKRTKLGLRDFITLGDFIQSINVAEGKAVNVIKFSAKGLNLLSGQLRIEASFKIASNSVSAISYVLSLYISSYNNFDEETSIHVQRVDISYDKSVITPDQFLFIHLVLLKDVEP